MSHPVYRCATHNWTGNAPVHTLTEVEGTNPNPKECNRHNSYVTCDKAYYVRSELFNPVQGVTLTMNIYFCSVHNEEIGQEGNTHAEYVSHQVKREICDLHGYSVKHYYCDKHGYVGTNPTHTYCSHEITHEHFSQ